MKPSDERRQPVSATPSLDERDAWTLASSVANDGLWFFDLARDEIRLSSRALELLGYAAGEPHPDRATLLRHFDAGQLPGFRAGVESLIRGERSRLEMELRLLTRGGETRWMQIRARARRGREGAITLVAGSMADVDRRKRAELALREELRRDPLTGLPNRAALGDWLTARIARAAVAPTPRFAV
ncbi:MAG: putative signaling protein, partial [Gemmatimonadetes bacterium]|nr:putative signaling protein [Gemmatimonadota bacterium]